MDTATDNMIRSELATLGLRWVDSPLSGGAPKVALGQLTLMVGGAAQDVAEAQQILQHLASNYTHMGPVGAGQTTKLIKAWKKHNGEELTGLSSYGWLCECQDWQHSKFAWRRTDIRQLQKNVLVVTVKVNAGFGDWGTQKLTMVKEGQRWVIDDLSSESAPFGVKAAMREELAETPAFKKLEAEMYRHARHLARRDVGEAAVDEGGPGGGEEIGSGVGAGGHG